MKIGYLQFEPALGEIDTNVRRVESLLPQTAGADLLVLPELSNSGYNFESIEQARALAEEIDACKMVAMLGEHCHARSMHVICGIHERDGDRLYNSSVLIGPNGPVGKYRKLHLFFNEKDIFQPGDLGLPVYDIGKCRVGMLICFDWVFPEVWRALALDGADVIGHPSNLVIPGLAQRAVPIQGLFNGVFTITANRIGAERELIFTGLSTIANPRGEVLAQAVADRDEVTLVEVDVAEARDKKLTPRNDRLADRRPDQYRRLTFARADQSRLSRRDSESENER